MSTGKLRFLTLVKPVLHVLPEVAQPDRKIPFKVRHRQPSVQCWRRACLTATRSRLTCASCGSAADRARAGEDSLDGDHALHLPRLLSDPDLWLQDQQVVRPLLLDAGAARQQPWHADGAGNLADHHVRPRHAGARVPTRSAARRALAVGACAAPRANEARVPRPRRAATTPRPSACASACAVPAVPPLG